MESPSLTAVTGRDPSTGRFGPGNGYGRGNPFGARAARLRTALLEAVTDEDLQAIVRTVAEKAKAGDLVAVKIILDYAIGKPTPARDPDLVAFEGQELEAKRARMEQREFEASAGFRTAL